MTFPRAVSAVVGPLRHRKGGSIGQPVFIRLPSGGYQRLLAACSAFSPVKVAGLVMVGSLLWRSRRRRGKDRRVLMRLVKPAALRFVDRVDGCSNPATFVARAWGCSLATRGCNINGKVANSWSLPIWCDGSSEEVALRLTRRQAEQWRLRKDILRECSRKANPHAAIVSETLLLTEPGPNFTAAKLGLTRSGELEAVRKYRLDPGAVNITREGDVHSNVSRLPSVMREALLIDGKSVVEFDVKSAHAVLLGVFYDGETGDQWYSERGRFMEEAESGFASIYGVGNVWKRGFLAALNQPTRVARHASPGYAEFERLFPLLSDKVARLRSRDPLAVGRRLRYELAEIMKRLIIENARDGIRTVPVVDSALIALPEDAFERHRAEFRTAWRLGAPIAEITGIAARIVGTDGEDYIFHLGPARLSTGHEI
jgi:hypothetical protein